MMTGDSDMRCYKLGSRKQTKFPQSRECHHPASVPVSTWGRLVRFFCLPYQISKLQGHSSTASRLAKFSLSLSLSVKPQHKLEFSLVCMLLLYICLVLSCLAFSAPHYQIYRGAKLPSTRRELCM
jgi:hypothetical protein